MVNCAHPMHFGHVLADTPAGRVRGVRANASSKSHAELDASDELDMGDPRQLADDVAGLRARGADLVVFGGCCGTDHRHIDALAEALAQ
jgi:homocysteine S-methyltransferase